MIRKSIQSENNGYKQQSELQLLSESEVIEFKKIFQTLDIESKQSIEKDDIEYLRKIEVNNNDLEQVINDLEDVFNIDEDLKIDFDLFLIIYDKRRFLDIKLIPEIKYFLKKRRMLKKIFRVDILGNEQNYFFNYISDQEREGHSLGVNDQYKDIKGDQHSDQMGSASFRTFASFSDEKDQINQVKMNSINEKLIEQFNKTDEEIKEKKEGCCCCSFI